MRRASDHFTHASRTAYLADQRRLADRQRLARYRRAQALLLALVFALAGAGLAYALPIAYASGEYPLPPLLMLSVACVSSLILAPVFVYDAVTYRVS
jgi:hypothetical protein